MNIILNALNVNPGQKILISVPDYMEENDIYEMTDVLKNNFPETKFVLMHGDFSIIASSYDDESLPIAIEG